MLKKILTAYALLAILLCPTLAFGRGGFSGGHSFSSGSHSFSSGSHSFSGGHSFSSGSSNFSGGHSFSSNSHGYSSAPQSSSSGNHSYSSGSSGIMGRGFSSPSPSRVGHSYASGSGGSTNSPQASRGFNPALTRAGQHESSRISYQNSRPTYQTPQGTTKTFTNSDSVRASTVRNYVTHERYITTYETRASNFYRGYQPMYYNDCWSPFLMGYLFSSAVSSMDRANWVYNNRDSLDELRYQQLLQRDAGLAAQIRQLQAAGQAPNPGYVLPGFGNNPDLQYSQNFVTASYEAPYQNPGGPSHTFSWIWILAGLALAAVVVFMAFR
jgi:hypothetical protein